MKPIIIVGGGKGGVGKSIVSMGCVDYLNSKGESVLLVESDTSNPDVYKAYKDVVKTELIDQNAVDGWLQLIDCCDSHPECTVVINSAARSSDGVAKYAQLLVSSLAELKRELVTLWVINRQRDSLELLKAYIDAVPDSKVHVVRNTHFGDAEKFELYRNSNIRLNVEDQGGKSVDFPDLADRVCDALYCQRLSIERAAKEMSIGNRAEICRWRSEVKKMFDEVISVR